MAVNIGNFRPIHAYFFNKKGNRYVLLKPHCPAVSLKTLSLEETHLNISLQLPLSLCFKWVDESDNLLMEVKRGSRAIREIFLVQVIWHDFLEARIINYPVREADIFDSNVCTLSYRFDLSCNTDEEG